MNRNILHLIHQLNVVTNRLLSPSHEIRDEKQKSETGSAKVARRDHARRVSNGATKSK